MFPQTRLQFEANNRVSSCLGGKLLPRKVAKMADLRLDNTDGEYLLLSLPTGETHRLVIDEALRKAVRRENFNIDDSSLISPREIQLEVRAGVTIEDLAAKTGASLDYVQKFAAPVIDELAHVVKSALSVRITMAGDRYSDTTQVEFGEVIANRLAGQGVVNYNWSARKNETGNWQVTCRYEDGQATWSFDSRKLALAPENELAVNLSSQHSLTEAPLPRLRSVETPALSENSGTTGTITLDAPPAPVSIAPVQHEDEQLVAEPVVEPTKPVSQAPVTPIWEKPVQESELSKPRQPAQTDRIAPVTNITADLGKTVEFDGVVPFGRSVDADDAKTHSGEGLANTADLLDALRRRRLEREQEVLNTNTGSINLVDLSEISDEPDFDGIDEPAPDTAPMALIDDVEETQQAESDKPKKSSRPSMPSWDEIVFNNRNDD